MAYNYSELDRGTDRFASYADRKAHGDVPFLPWFLRTVRAADEKSRVRSLDVLSVHFYPAPRGVYSDDSDPKLDWQSRRNDVVADRYFLARRRVDLNRSPVADRHRTGPRRSVDVNLPCPRVGNGGVDDGSEVHGSEVHGPGSGGTGQDGLRTSTAYRCASGPGSGCSGLNQSRRGRAGLRP